jgi:hypothetical protein
MLSLFNKLFALEKWNIGYVYQTPQSLIHFKKLSAITWLKEYSADEAADPFIIDINGRNFIYFEEHSFWKGRGELMVMDKLDFKNKNKVSGIVPQSIHLSYPYVFKADSKLYCIPETSAAKEIGLYEVDVHNPHKFQKIKTVVSGKSFVDSSIISYKNKYWLFTSISGKQGQLYIYYSDTLEGEFKPHSLNPITVEPNVSRSAGRLFMVDQKLYMPSQNPKKCYGGSITINEITQITGSEFQYNTAFELMPQLPYDMGLHTINFAGDLIIVDGKRTVFSVLSLFKKILMKVRKMRKEPNNALS